MKVYMKLFIVLSLVFSFNIFAGEWVTLEPQNLADIEVAQAGALSFANEGVYFKRNPSFSTTYTCAKKEFVVITDPKLADRALSAVMFAMASNKTIRFYVDGCNNDYLQGKMFMLLP